MRMIGIESIILGLRNSIQEFDNLQNSVTI